MPWAQIEIDGREFGETPLGEVELPVGEHEVTVRFPDGSEVARRTARTKRIEPDAAAVLARLAEADERAAHDCAGVRQCEQEHHNR